MFLTDHYAPAAGVSWILSYGVVYDVPKIWHVGADHVRVAKRCFAKSGNMLSLSCGLSAAVNFGLRGECIAIDYDPTLIKFVAVAEQSMARVGPVVRFDARTAHRSSRVSGVAAMKSVCDGVIEAVFRTPVGSLRQKPRAKVDMPLESTLPTRATGHGPDTASGLVGVLDLGVEVALGGA